LQKLKCHSITYFTTTSLPCTSFYHSVCGTTFGASGLDRPHNIATIDAANTSNGTAMTRAKFNAVVGGGCNCCGGGGWACGERFKMGGTWFGGNSNGNTGGHTSSHTNSAAFIPSPGSGKFVTKHAPGELRSCPCFRPSTAAHTSSATQFWQEAVSHADTCNEVPTQPNWNANSEPALPDAGTHNVPTTVGTP
jgi:hypothetical protein